jgi:hypothetical protein
MGEELVQDFVDGFSVCVEGDAGEVELGGGDRGDGGSVCLVMRGGEEVVCEDGEPSDVARHRSLIGAAEPGRSAA